MGISLGKNVKLFFLVLTLVTLTACDSGTDGTHTEYKSLLIGKWRVPSEEGHVEFLSPNTVLFYIKNNSDPASGTWRVSDDGAVLMNFSHEGETAQMSANFNGETLTLEVDGEKASMTKF